MELRRRTATSHEESTTTNVQLKDLSGHASTLHPTADPEADASLTPHALTKQEAEEEGLQPLTFLPLMLRTSAMCGMLAFNFAVLCLLIVLLFFDSFKVSGQWGYLAIQIMPPVLGTITSTLFQATAMDLSRITPYMLAAAPAGSTFHKTLMSSYFSLADAIAARNGVLTCVWILDIFFDIVLSFKASLLNTDDYQDYVEAIVTTWALFALIGLYCLITTLTVFLLFMLHNRITGLRWDSASLADCLALFRNSDFLDWFEGTDIATRDSTHDHLGHNRIKLGYWRHGDSIRHGFRSLPDEPLATAQTTTTPSTQDNVSARSRSEEGSERPAESEQQPATTNKYTWNKIHQIRYRSAALNMEHWTAYVWVGIILLLLGGFVAMLALGFVDGRNVPIEYERATVVFQFAPTFLVTLFTWYWQDVDHFARSTQPFRGLASPNPASENLLLEYTTLPAVVVSYIALKNGHTRVAWTSLIAVLQRLLPILTAGSTTIVPDETSCTVYASKPIFICILVWLGLYVFLIPLVNFGWPISRHNIERRLPRSYSSISDLLSWTYASKLLRQEDGSPFEVPVKGPKAKQWYMTSRLMLMPQQDEQSLAQYSFGLYRSVTHDDVVCMGLDVASNVSTVNVNRKREDVEANDEHTAMLAHPGLECVLDTAKEQQTNTQPLLRQRIPQQQEQTEEQAEGT